jgi:HSP20 family protein
MKTLTKPYDLFDLMKSNLDSTLFDNFIYSNGVTKKTLSNIKENEDYISIEMITPGFKKNEIEIFFENNLLTIKGKRELKKENESTNYILTEYNVNEFSRSFKINPNLNSDDITSSLEDGILIVKVPRLKKVDNKKIIKLN